jgi:hypothetical protein
MERVGSTQISRYPTFQPAATLLKEQKPLTTLLFFGAHPRGAAGKLSSRFCAEESMPSKNFGTIIGRS